MLAARLPLRTAASLRRAGAPRALCSKAVGESIADNTKASTFTGTPASLLGKRIVKIFQPPHGVQNGNQNTTVWRMQWEDEYTKRWTNPLMGWTSTSDPLSNTHMTLEFHTAEDAVRFAEENGWIVEVQQPKPNTELHARPKKYADNFKWKGPKGRAFPDLYIPPPPKK
ncbi:hypothetical protein AB1Y20_013435 [Prymnesium parvum]|uniref:NADH dehydrogenase [ubiquinone] iron-sulfur protein 4, mitochondrial n=1 Tax=Prymnesium parvum TaxID=97485 RepID=A0AB34IIN7_PRYPA